MEMQTGKGTEKTMSIPSAHQGRRRYRTTYNDKQTAPPDNDTQHNDLFTNYTRIRMIMHSPKIIILRAGIIYD